MGMGQGILDTLLGILGRRDLLPSLDSQIFGPGPWDENTLPHENTTRLARFHPGGPVSASEATSTANAIYQARCEISDENICVPVSVSVSSGGSCVAIAAAGGWKNRDPVVHYYLPEEDGEFEESMSLEPGLGAVATELTLDEDRKLIFVADRDRIKSFMWVEGSGDAVHTLNSSKYSGPIALLPNGRIVRAGKGAVAYWNINELEVHGPGMKKIGHGEYSTENSWRDNEDDEIELSTGSKAHGTVKFAEKVFVPSTWHYHRPTSQLLCGESRQDESRYSCIAVDLEHNGKTAAQYLGHGGTVTAFSTSESDPHMFATAASDGFARLYDVRHPLPALTMDSGQSCEPCSDVVLVHPDGVPTLFTGGSKTERIQLWDIRARRFVYELATGNNAVVSMAWDESRSTLLAATECEYMDRLGRHHDYRRAKLPSWEKDPRSSNGSDDEDEDMDQEDDDDEYDDERCWPTRAHHGEDFFGYTFDAGDHRLYRYAFKADADTDMTPAYGDARIENDDYSW
ncbi:WD40 repeat-like protein [Obba rivulosa]|uniref:WD40 repeat-like protein n=1 Tax=Obba rivulosa TaxID=1052685 RepID=A0A8E2DJH1_9APHY|nr:WD40 repeat-like protein [Obba rivulosa]